MTDQSNTPLRAFVSTSQPSGPQMSSGKRGAPQRIPTPISRSRTMNAAMAAITEKAKVVMCPPQDNVCLAHDLREA